MEGVLALAVSSQTSGWFGDAWEGNDRQAQSKLPPSASAGLPEVLRSLEQQMKPG
jgi:hypothetical protein